MPQIAEHNGEQEWESDDGVKRWIGFAIRSDTEGVDQVLEALRELVRAIERRRSFICRYDIHERGNCRADLLRALEKRLLHQVRVVGRNPALADQALLTHVHVEHVQSVINRLDFLHVNDPLRQLLQDAQQDAIALILGLIDDHVQVLEANLNSLQHVFAFFVVIRAWIQTRMVTGANLLDARLQLFALKEGDENVLVDLLALK